MRKKKVLKGVPEAERIKIRLNKTDGPVHAEYGVGVNQINKIVRGAQRKR